MCEVVDAEACAAVYVDVASYRFECGFNCTCFFMAESGVPVPVSVYRVCIDDLRGAIALLEGGQTMLRGMM